MLVRSLKFKAVNQLDLYGSHHNNISFSLEDIDRWEKNRAVRFIKLDKKDTFFPLKVFAQILKPSEMYF